MQGTGVANPGSRPFLWRGATTEYYHAPGFTVLAAKAIIHQAWQSCTDTTEEPWNSFTDCTLVADHWALHQPLCTHALCQSAKTIVAGQWYLTGPQAQPDAHDRGYCGPLERKRCLGTDRVIVARVPGEQAMACRLRLILVLKTQSLFATCGWPVDIAADR